MTSASSQDTAPRRRLLDPRVRTGLVLAATVALVLVAASYAWHAFTAPFGDRQAPGAAQTVNACPTPGQPAAPRPAPGEITVNVYNATTRSRLASAAARDLRARGFGVGEVANDPARAQIPGLAEVRAGETGRPAAEVLLGILPGATLVLDGRPDSTVDVALGDAFNGLGPPVDPAAPLPGC